MDNYALTMAHRAIDIPADNSVLSEDEKILDMILENKATLARRRFGLLDLWNIRRNTKRFNNYR